MSKDETTPSGGGILSKMVRFVRNPTVNWNELDSIQEDKESQYSKQMLKEMIERKRRNDFVRRREFDQLRKLRQRDALSGQRTEDSAARPSFFQSSLTSPDERAVTIKKIDEIEAQMSMQWWKSKQSGDAPAPGGSQAPGDFAAQTDGSSEYARASSRAFAPTAPLSLHASLSPQAAAEPLFADDSMTIEGFGNVSSQTLTGAPGPAAGARAPVPEAPAAPEMEEFVHEPDLEEAAIRFANGDHVGAEAGLLDVLAQHAQDDADQQFEIWMTLFDLYRATGQQDRFDTLAIDFAARFSRSAPLWFSMPEQLGLDTVVQDTPAPVVRRDFTWNAPGALTLQSVAALQASLARTASPWTMTWSRIQSIDDAALTALANEFTRWADLDAQINFVGADALQTLMEAQTQSGDRSANPEWWRLRMAALRFMARPDEFEMVALDFCVTYEVSPPSWASPRCGYSDSSAPAPVAAPAPMPDLVARARWKDTATPAPLTGFGDTRPPMVGLSGHIEGDAGELLAGMEGQVPAGEPLIILCDRLIRIDFSAAGSVLNWAAEQQAHGRVVQFQNLHRLVAVFFNVVGISEHAWVVPRKN